MIKKQIINSCIYLFALYYSITFSGSQKVILFEKTVVWFPTEIEIKTPFSRTLTYATNCINKINDPNPDAIPIKLKIISLF